MQLSLEILSHAKGSIILGRDWVRTKGNLLWKRGKAPSEPPTETFRTVASCYWDEAIETLVVTTGVGSRTEVTFFDRDRATLTLQLPFAEVDRLIAALQGARAIVNSTRPHTSRALGKCEMLVVPVNEDTLKDLPSATWVHPVELGLYPDLG